MKNTIGFVVVASILSSGQALAMETSVDRVGMVYVKVPLTKKFMRSNDTALGFRFGQTRFSTNRYGYLLNSFKNNPAVVEFEFRPAGQFGDIRFRLQEFKINGISSLEKQYITGGMGFVAAPAAGAVIAGLGTVAAVGVMAASSSSSKDDSSDDSNSTPAKPSAPAGSKPDDSPDSKDDVADDDHQDDDDHHADDDNDDSHDDVADDDSNDDDDSSHS